VPQDSEAGAGETRINKDRGLKSGLATPSRWRYNAAVAETSTRPT
jgi:hypothetical protein